MTNWFKWLKRLVQNYWHTYNRMNFGWIVPHLCIWHFASATMILYVRRAKLIQSKRDREQLLLCKLYGIIWPSGLCLCSNRKNACGRSTCHFSAAPSPPLPAWQIPRWIEVMLSETLKAKWRPWRYDNPWSKQYCLVSAHHALTILTNKDGLRMMTQVEFNSLFGQKGKQLRERNVSVGS